MEWPDAGPRRSLLTQVSRGPRRFLTGFFEEFRSRMCRKRPADARPRLGRQGQRAAGFEMLDLPDVQTQRLTQRGDLPVIAPASRAI